MSRSKTLITYKRPLTHCLIAGTQDSLDVQLSAGNRGGREVHILRLKMPKNYTRKEQKAFDKKTARKKAKKSDATASSRRTAAKIGQVCCAVRACQGRPISPFHAFVTRVLE